MQSWVRDDPSCALENKQIVICGSGMSGECKYAAAHENVVAIVDDFRRHQADELFGIPLISTDEWLSLARGNASIVSLVFASTVAGYNHFMRCCAQNDL